jgi:succinate dehydrogenase/fumarate reductase flavoprotein subunit
MWAQVGVNRQEQGLSQALAAIAKMKADYLPRLTVDPARVFNLSWIQALETANMLELAGLVTEAALARQETRGHHFRLDFPQRNDEQWLKHIVFRRENGENKRWTEPASKRTS